VTEAEWLECRDPLPMLDLVSGTAGGRKLRLFAAACSRRAWGRLDDLGRAAVEAAEQFADGLAGADALRAARLACRGAGAAAAWYAAATRPAVAARNAALSALAGADPRAERAAQAGLLRCVLGNPFRPVTVGLTWLTPAVVALARHVYESGDFTPMATLADALQDAGCDNDEVLDHCCNPGPHARGCWVVDLVLGKG
jgi:hypothetical protein